MHYPTLISHMCRICYCVIEQVCVVVKLSLQLVCLINYRGSTLELILAKHIAKMINDPNNRIQHLRSKLTFENCAHFLGARSLRASTMTRFLCSVCNRNIRVVLHLLQPKSKIALKLRIIGTIIGYLAQRFYSIFAHSCFTVFQSWQ